MSETRPDAQTEKLPGDADGVPPSTPRRATPSNGRFAPGDLISDRYRIVSLLGAGGMGEVYRAEDTRLGQEVALKFLPAAYMRDRELLERLHQEVRVGRTLAHPNLCRLYDIGEANGAHFIAMEYVSGENLSSLLRRIGRLPHDKALEIARGLCAGLAAAHAKGILHRDLKPANVMIDSEGEPRITDFGLAADDAMLDSERGAVVGTPAYMAPEQLRGARPSVRSDLFALGMIFYEMFTGRRPFAGGDVTELLATHERMSIARPSSHVRDVDPAVETVILRCLARDPAERPADVVAVMKALPGGDPLAAALAAGRTPSPELVAAAGEEGTLRVPVAAALVIGALVVFATLLFLAKRTMLIANLKIRDVVVLRDASQQLIAAVAQPDPNRESSEGFFEKGRFVRYVQRSPQELAKASNLLRLSPAIQYWYRERPQGAESPDLQPVTSPDVSVWAEGTQTVFLDSGGRLVAYFGAPRGSADVTRASKRVDWSALHAMAGVTGGSFVAVTPRTEPPFFADHREAWEGTLAGEPDRRMRIEAASLHGWPVWYEVEGPWDRDARRSAPFFSGTTFAIALGLVVLLVAVGSALLAWRNVKRGRADIRGTLRFAGVMCALHLAKSLLGSDHASNFLDEAVVLKDSFASATSAVALLVIVYLALEPVIRRHWPEQIVSWTRVVTGRVNDALVGRHVLIGTIVGLLHTTFILTMESMKPHRVPLVVNDLSALGTFRFGASTLLAAISSATFQGLFLAALLVMALVVTRRRAFAVVVLYGVTFVLLFLAFRQTTFALGWALVMSALLIATLYFAGPLGIAAMQSVFFVTFHYPVVPTAGWLLPTSILSIAYVLGLIYFGFTRSIGVRTLKPDWIGDDAISTIGTEATR
jgi:predicted Ser/Thr protein kinase